MGDRGQVHIKDEGVWLYTHWAASELTDTVRVALSKRARWNDAEYLARIIFDEMIGDRQGQQTGYGISSHGPHGDEWRIIEVNCKTARVIVKDNDETVIDQTFDEFVKS